MNLVEEKILRNQIEIMIALASISNSECVSNHLSNQAALTLNFIYSEKDKNGNTSI